MERPRMPKRDSSDVTNRRRERVPRKEQYYVANRRKDSRYQIETERTEAETEGAKDTETQQETC